LRVIRISRIQARGVDVVEIARVIDPGGDHEAVNIGVGVRCPA
jgi:hypothetical protein